MQVFSDICVGLALHSYQYFSKSVTLALPFKI